MPYDKDSFSMQVIQGLSLERTFPQFTGKEMQHSKTAVDRK